MAQLDKNFVSAVVYLGNEKDVATPFLAELTGRLGARFEHYELVFVDDSSRDGTVEAVRAFVEGMETPPPVTMIHMSLKQGLELAMNAGMDMAIGDFVYEFDTMHMPYPPDLVNAAYDTCLAGSDIVSVAPQKNRGFFASAFYRLFNAGSGSKYPLRTDVFRLLSRRAINRVHSISHSLPYRKAAYAASGLKLSTLVFHGNVGKHSDEPRLSRAVDSLLLYTGIGHKVSLAIAGVMLLLMLAALAYTLAIFLGGGQPEAGWTTTMLMLTGGFSALFLMFSIVLKYLSLILELVFKNQRYLVESIEKIV